MRCRARLARGPVGTFAKNFGAASHWLFAETPFLLIPSRLPSLRALSVSQRDWLRAATALG